MKPTAFLAHRQVELRTETDRRLSSPLRLGELEHALQRGGLAGGRPLFCVGGGWWLVGQSSSELDLERE